MAGAAGPNTAESGLVFAYDTGNTVTSYLGEPLVNCATDLSSGYNVTVTEVTDGSISPPFPGMRVYKFVTANNYNLYRQGGYYNGGGFGGSNPQPLILGTTTPSNFTTVGTGKYRFGMYIRGEVTNQVGDGVTIDIGDRNQVGTTVGTNTNWQLLQTDDTLGIADSNYPYDFFDIGASFSMTFYVAGYGIWRSPGTVTNLPFLQAYPISTQYITYGQSRSVTQGLLDLTGNRVINIANLSFDSNAQMTFDGTNDYGQSDVFIPSITSKSYEAVTRLYDVNQQAGGVIGMMGENGEPFDTIVYNETGQGWGFGSTGFERTAWSGVKETTTGFVHLVATYENYNYKLYRNGVLILTTTSYAALNYNFNTVVIFGKRHGTTTGPFNGEIPLAKIYNRVLSATEVKQNFEAIRDRFGI